MEKDIIALYEELISGKRKKMPNGTWKNNGKNKAVKLLKYILNGYTKEQICELNWAFFEKNKLQGMMENVFHQDYHEALELCFGIEPWEFKQASQLVRKDKDKMFRSCKWFIEEFAGIKNPDEIPQKLNYEVYQKSHLYYLEIAFGKSMVLFKIADTVYPGKFSPFDFKCKNKYKFNGSRQKAIEYVRKFFHNKMGFKDNKQIAANATCELMYNYGMHALLYGMWNGSITRCLIECFDMDKDLLKTNSFKMLLSHSAHKIVYTMYRKIYGSKVKIERLINGLKPDIRFGRNWHDVKLNNYTAITDGTFDKYLPHCDSLTIICIKGSPITKIPDHASMISVDEVIKDAKACGMDTKKIEDDIGLIRMDIIPVLC